MWSVIIDKNLKFKYHFGLKINFGKVLKSFKDWNKDIKITKQ